MVTTIEECLIDGFKPEGIEAVVSVPCVGRPGARSFSHGGFRVVVTVWINWGRQRFLLIVCLVAGVNQIAIGE